MEMFKIMNCIYKISAEDRTRGHNLRVKKRRIKTRVRPGTFTQRVINAWNGLPGKVVAAETVDKFKLKLDRYLEVLEIKGYRDVNRTFWYLEH